MTVAIKRRIGILLGVVGLLLIPLIAMQFTSEVNWNLFDFAVAATLLLAAGLTVEYVLRKVNKKDLRIGIVVAVLVALLLIWMELAVGIFGSPFAGS